MFDLRGGLSKEDFAEKTKLLSSLPRHMKYTLFHNDEKIKKVRTKEFPLVFFVYDEVKDCKCFLDDVAVEEDSYNACIVFLLMSLASAYMELRHYSEVIQCLNECLTIAGDKVPDIYFRRSQARTYNRGSSDEELTLAKEDIEKAISLKKETIYVEHQERLLKIIEERKKNDFDRIESNITMK